MMPTSREDPSENSHDLAPAHRAFWEEPLNWMRLHCVPTAPRKNDKAANIALLAAIVMTMFQIGTVHRAVKDSRKSDPSPIQFQQWESSQKVYRPGDVVQFTFERDASETGHVVLQIDSFINDETGEGYPGATIARFINEPGKIKRRAARHLPEFITPGRYHIEGMTQSQTSIRTLPAAYRSNTFEVKGIPGADYNARSSKRDR
jgi:hypothetical protein